MMSVQNMIVEAANRHGVDPALALAVAQQESGFNPSAVSPAGAVGVMQLMPATAADLGVDPYNTAQNIDGGVSYLRQMLNMFPSVEQALAAYNFGPGNVSRGKDWPAETRNYVSNVTSDWQQTSEILAGVAPGTEPTLLAGAGIPSKTALLLLLVVGAGLVLASR